MNPNKLKLHEGWSDGRGFHSYCGIHFEDCRYRAQPGQKPTCLKCLREGLFPMPAGISLDHHDAKR